MDYLMPAFKIVSSTFAIAAVVTGARATVDPIGFSRSFGLPLSVNATTSGSRNDTTTVKTITASNHGNSTARSYVSLMGVRQLATGLILLTFAYQNKWMEIATILSIIGIIVAGTDGFHLSRAGQRQQGRAHAIPGALIAMLAGAVVYSGG